MVPKLRNPNLSLPGDREKAQVSEKSFSVTKSDIHQKMGVKVTSEILDRNQLEKTGLAPFPLAPRPVKTYRNVGHPMLKFTHFAILNIALCFHQ